ncbi:probable enoyl-CoA hydratase [Amphibalanus amphitrite]|uniref:probable enoyl-CoA hydratase n=1 Tax=Amphibalanus amphitrite TaxID=1232801 RepID=UPI001C9110ED|nr:probable enoyl-CoA hydratase [Amphibalanus amphitrite]XP_043220688.1 probable enoyl-CoA hydratase [Amphibalanus amphitrite]XP_043220689.1 probable enoyl-CoA hydratase [Amphibalanus amphitrite]XP_043220690.1 probable enoyl-CoA hydratase [Amphibalanus amphitrite]
MAVLRLLRERANGPFGLQRCLFSSDPPADAAPHVLTGRVGSVTTIALNRTASRNSISAETALQLTAALRRFEADTTSPVAVLHGRGGNFCSGCDLAELAAGEEPPPGPAGQPCAKPVVAAVDGFAVGGGLELALWCDLRVVEETAVLGAYGRRFGVPLLDGGADRLPLMVGLSRALDMILTGRAVSGQEAFEWGLANRLVACGTALAQAVNLASSIAKFPAECVAADRRAAYRAAFEAASPQEALREARAAGRGPLEREGRHGARRFLAGVGRHGKFNIHPEKQEEWNRR